ncbi:hypothetical protein J6590_088882 [Homalodisca vitripennis]|nr:hypothetical protein J6590_088882 [Homalodisca vitripennis]
MSSAQFLRTSSNTEKRFQTVSHAYTALRTLILSKDNQLKPWGLHAGRTDATRCRKRFTSLPVNIDSIMWHPLKAIKR